MSDHCSPSASPARSPVRTRTMKNVLANLYFPARISPIRGGRQHRRERAQDVQHRFPRRTSQLVNEDLLILGTHLIEAELPELRKNVRVEMGISGAHC